MQEIACHNILIKGADYQDCKAKVIRFFDKTNLVQYDHMEFVKSHSICGSDNRFFSSLEDAININKNKINDFISNIEQTGIKTVAELATIKQGYPSKSLHILSHFMDGFIGIDSNLYNLVDDSHWVSPERKKKISDAPDQYWIIFIRCYSLSPDEATLLHH